MSILPWFNKPKWQSKNEQVRLTAVQHSNEVELKAHLLQINNYDDSPKVQRAALSRLNEIQVIASIAQEHTDPAIRNLAEKKLAQVLVQLNTTNLSETEVRLVKAIKNNEVRRQIAEMASAPELRMAAIDNLNQQGLLGDLLMAESDTTVQNAILAKISQESTLKRLLKKLSHKHPELKLAIEQKLNLNRPADSKIIAEQICKQLEDVVLRKHQVDLAELESQWQKLTDLPDNLMTRYQGALNTAKLTLDSSYRDTFLQQQKKLRQQQALKEFTHALERADNSRLSELQSLIQQFQDADIEQLTADEQTQWQKLLNELQVKITNAQQTTALPAACHRILTDINQQLGNKSFSPQQLSRYKKQWQQTTKQLPVSDDLTALQNQFDHALLQLTDKIAHSAKQRDEAAEKVVSLIEPIQLKIKDGQLTVAKAEMNKLAELQKQCGFNHPTLKQHKFQIDQLWQQLKELRQWQQWSHDKVRKQLISELQELVGSGLHPDAVLQKLQQANQQWSDLEDMEKLPGDRYSPRNQKQWLDFRTVSQALFEPAQPYFEKRSEQQDAGLEKVQAYITQMQQVDLENTPAPELAKLTQHAVTHLKNLDRLSPKDRGKIAKALRQAMERINQHLAIGYKTAESNKQNLLDQALALADMENLEAAIEAAKDLQKQWPEQGYVKPHIERKLWQKFRKANDRIFNRRSAEQQATKVAADKHNKQINQWFKQQQQMITECKNVDSLAEIMSIAREGWQSLENESTQTNAKWQQLMAEMETCKQHLKSQQKQQQFQSWQQVDDLYLQFELDKIKQEILQQKLSEFDKATLTPFQSRTESTVDTDLLLQLLIEAEYLTGIETPTDFHEQRMAYQVQVLADRMAGNDNLERGQDRARHWLHHWYTLSKADKKFYQQHKKRIVHILSAIINLAAKVD